MTQRATNMAIVDILKDITNGAVPFHRILEKAKKLEDQLINDEGVKLNQVNSGYLLSKIPGRLAAQLENFKAELGTYGFDLTITKKE